MNQINFNKVKFRCSAVGNIMTNLEWITPKQLERIEYLEGRPKPTDKQKEELKSLKEKRDAGDRLPTGAKSYLQKVYNELVYGIREDVSTDAMEKGNLTEDDGFDLLTQLMDELYDKRGFLKKNEDFFENTYVMGTPDTITKRYVIDVKSSWNKDSFDTAEMKGVYYWQLMSYMWLTKRKNAMLAYCLLDTPIELINDTVRRICYREGVNEGSDRYAEIDDQVVENLTFSHKIPAKNRLKTYFIHFKQEQINHLKRRVRMSREYLWELHKEDVKYKPIIKF